MMQARDILEPNMLREHPVYVLVIAVVVILLFVGIAKLRRR